MKKSLILLTILGLFVALPLAGCGKKDDPETASGFKNDKPVPAEDGAGAGAATK